MTENLEIDALEYLLEEMEPERRAAFEALLARDPVARESLKACADALGRFACDTAPAEPMSAADQQAVLSTILTATHAKPPTPASPEHKVIVWPRFVWPIAAALLLGLNVYQLRQAPSVFPSGERSRREPAALAARSGDAPHQLEPGAEASGQEGTAWDEEPTTAPGALTTAKRTVTRTSGTMSAAGQLEQLRREYAELQRVKDALRADYDQMIRSVAERALLEKSVGRLATMELVDAASFAQGNRKGLMEVARGILTEPGVVVAEVTSPPTGPTTEENLSGAGMNTGSDSGNSTPDKTPDPMAPYAWSVFDDKENRGYLNLYNLPKAPADQSLQLWVKTVDSPNYQRVGEVPVQFQGGNGSLYYNLPTATSVPSEILITQESRGATGAEPAGMVVLRGP